MVRCLRTFSVSSGKKRKTVSGFKAHQQAAFLGVEAAQTPVGAQLQIAVGIFVPDQFSQLFRGVQIVGMSQPDLAAAIAQLLHALPDLADCPFLAPALMHRLQIAQVAGLAHNAYTQNTDCRRQRRADAAIFGKVGERFQRKHQVSTLQIGPDLPADLFKVQPGLHRFPVFFGNLMLQIQQDSYPTERAYEYFRKELKNVLDFVFGLKEKLDNVGAEDTEQKFLLRKAVIAFAYKMYLDIYFAALKAEKIKD